MGHKGNIKDRLSKTLEQKVLDLDAHLYLLRTHLNSLRDSASHVKAIATELRTLVCRSSGTEGLLYRLIHELSVDDSINLHVPGDLIPDHPLVQGLQFAIVPIKRGGQGPAEIQPHDHSFRGVIRYAQALVAVGKPLTHEYLIKAVAQQMGSAHEDEGIEPALAQLSEIFINGVEPFVEVLGMDAELTLEVGERVLEAAERRGILKRPHHSHNYGNVTIVFRIQINEVLANPIQLYSFHAYGPSATITCSVTAYGVEFLLTKNGSRVAELSVPYPDSFQLGDDVVFALSYCSRTRQVRTMTAKGAADPVSCQLGWIHANDLEITVEQDHKGLEQRFLLTYERLLLTKDVTEMLSLPSNGYGLWKPHEELEARGPFPD